MEKPMNNDIQQQDCQCQCGATKFTITGKPIVRVFCHCTICQAFNHAAYADVTIFLAKDVHLQDKNQVRFKQYKSPPAVDRGKCASCDKPALELFELPLFPSLAMVPSENIPSGAFLPEPSAHIFYHRAVAPIDDQLPKHNGFIKSQAMLGAKLVPGLFRKLLGTQ